MAASMKAVGSTHDSLAFKMSGFYNELKAGKLTRSIGYAGLQSYYGMGDDAYADANFLVTPWPGRDLATVRDNFNYWQSRLRIVVECAFGRLTKRFGCLWKPLQVATWKVPPLVNAFLKLHNYCSNITLGHSQTDLRHFIRTGQTPCVFNNTGALAGEELRMYRLQRREGKANNTRLAVTDHLRNIGATRPPHSRYRSRTKQSARAQSMAGKAPRKAKGGTTKKAPHKTKEGTTKKRARRYNWSGKDK